MYRYRFAALIVLLTTSVAVSADVVDDFTAAQGPITVGPGEEPTEEEGTLLTPDVLGGFRVLVPVVDEDAPPGNTATTSIAGGVFECETNARDFTGGCSVGWPGTEPTDSFDLTEAGAFEFEVLEADMGAIIAVALLDGAATVGDVAAGLGETGVVSFVENPTPGNYTLPLDQFINLNPLETFDFSAVTVVAVFVFFGESVSGKARIGAISTTGPISDGPPVIPPDDPDEETPSDEDLRQLASGSYFDPTRSGEGCQVTVEGDSDTVIITCYFYRDGEQAWFISNGVISNGQATFDLTITEGADYGEDFDPDDVERTPWGTGTFSWIDCNSATLALTPTLPGYEAVTLELVKIVSLDCNGAGPDPVAASYAGTLYDVNRSGEGFHITQQGDSNIYAIAWYTYLDGRQVWLFGSGERVGNRTVFDDTVITRGTGWGPNFDADEVETDPWGTITLDYSACSDATFTAEPLPDQPLFTAVEGEVSGLVAGTCP